MFKKNMEIFINIMKMKAEQNFPIVLSGSTSLYLQGVNIEVNDLDILTDSYGAEYLDNILKEFCIKKSEYSTTDKYKSHFGIYEIDNVKIDIMGEFQYKLKSGEWSIPNHTNKIYLLKYDNIEIPVLSLEQELVEYQNTGKKDTILKINEKLNFKKVK